MHRIIMINTGKVATFSFTLKTFRNALFLCIAFSIKSIYADSMTIDKSTNTYTGYGTVGEPSHLSGVLNPGDEVEVGAKTKTAARVTATSGVNEGRSAWTELNNLTGNASEVDSDSTDPYLLGQISETVPYNLNQNMGTSSKKPAWLDQEGVQEEKIPNSTLYTPVTDQEIWDGASGENPTYKLDADAYDGGEYIPFYKETYDAFGTPTRTRHYVKADPEKAVRLQQKARKVITTKQSTYCESGIHQTTPAGPQGSWIPSCEILQNKNLGRHNAKQLSQCVLNMRKAIQSNGKSRSALLRNMYRKLNSREQEFAAMIFTTIGEGRSENHADRVMIMKVLNNRARYAQENGYECSADNHNNNKKCPNELDAALQPWQFSMYNANDPNWRTALLGTNSNNNDIAKSVESYLMYRNTSFGDGSTANSIYHYHTPGVNPNWSDPNKRVHPTPNGESPSTHKFFSGVAWSFANNEFQP